VYLFKYGVYYLLPLLKFIFYFFFFKSAILSDFFTMQFRNFYLYVLYLKM